MIDPKLILDSFPHANLTIEMVQDFLSTIDYDSMYASYLKSFKVSMWDHQTPINGVSAGAVLNNRPEIDENSRVILVSDPQKVIYFKVVQTPDDENLGEFLREIAESHTRSAIFQHVMNELASTQGDGHGNTIEDTVEHNLDGLVN